MLEQLDLTREHSELFWSLIEAYVCSVLNFFVFILPDAATDRSTYNPEDDKWFLKKKMDGCKTILNM